MIFIKKASAPAYFRHREEDFGVIDRVAEAFADMDSDDLQAKIMQATDEVKSTYNARSLLHTNLGQ